MFDALAWLAFTLGILLVGSGLWMLVTRRMVRPLVRHGSARDPVRWGGFNVLFGGSVVMNQLGSMISLSRSVERGLSVVSLLGIVSALIWYFRPQRRHNP